MELCTREKAVFFLPVNILMEWSLTFLAARHITMCLNLDYSLKVIFVAYDIFRVVLTAAVWQTLFIFRENSTKQYYWTVC